MENNAQFQAIHHGIGPMMVLAGPGAGKTFVITNRVAALIAEHRVPPEEILVVTFSRAAAIEMKERFEIITEGACRGVRFGTFHSVFFEILKKAYHYEAKDIVSDRLKYRLIGEAVADTGFEVEDRQEFLESLEKEISRVKGEGIDIASYYSANCPEEMFRAIYRGYQQRLMLHRALDFDDMVVYTYDLLRKREDLLSSWQKRFRYILIDEFQDINRLQFENIKMLAKPEDNIFIVGDDDQSIYGFRGARPDIMLGFKEQYPSAETITLQVNYRCSKEILEAAGHLITHNKKRYGKDITAENGSDEPVHISEFADLLSEGEAICGSIRRYLNDGVPPDRIAVLFRTNIQMRTIAGKLMDQAVPFRMKEGMPDMFKSFMARDIIAYIKMACGGLSRDLFIQVMNRPVRYISRKALTGDPVNFKELRSYYMKQKQFWMLDRLSEFEQDIITLRKMSPITAIHYIRKQIGYDDYLKEKALDRGMKPDDWLETVEEIEDSASGMTSLAEWLEFTENYGEELKKLSESREKAEAPAVELMTMHGSKGLEFDVVFIPTINEGVCPYRKATLEAELEEERRMLYVAMTRARNRLHLSSVKRRYNKKAEKSRFLDEITN